MNGSAVPITRFAAEASQLAFRSRTIPPIERFARLDALTPGCAALFAAAEQESVFLGAGWYRTVLDHALPADAEPCFVAFPSAEAPLALFPLQLLNSGSRLESLTTPYTCLFRPLFSAGVDAATVRQAGAALGWFCRAWPMVRIDALPADYAMLEPLLAGVRQSGLLVRRFDHFANWHETVRGRSWEEYLADRPGPLRTTIRRKLRRCEGEAWLEVVDAPGVALEQAIADYELVYSRSWKEPEPFPRFNPALMRVMAAAGRLRLGVLRVREQAVAAQFWIVEPFRATLLKLAHDEACKSISPGSVLTALMIHRLLDEERVVELDFGRGDDVYKHLWAGSCRWRVGVVLANPRRLRGLAVLGRDWLGHSVLRRLWDARSRHSPKTF